MKNGYIHRCGKVLGGIKNILLTEKSNIRSLKHDPRTGNYTDISFVDPGRVACCTFAEGSVSYQEDLQARNGIVSVDHALEFITDKMDEESGNLLRGLVKASYSGLVAIVTTRNDVRLLIGYSEENRDERPLRITRSTASSGKKHTDPAGETIVLHSCDTAKARIFSGSIG